MIAHSPSSIHIEGGWDKLVYGHKCEIVNKTIKRHSQETLDITNSTHKVDCKDTPLYTTIKLGVCVTN